jgi:hypothetical protein
VVSPAKFRVLWVATLGLYELAWMYQHWAHIKRATRGDQWPVWRAIFSIFFYHRLAADIDQHMARMGVHHPWNPRGIATVVVLLLIAIRVLDRFAFRSIGSPGTDLASLGLMFVVMAYVAGIQRAANAACGDPAGQGNARFTMGNGAWMTFGVVLWLLTLIGMFMPAG